MANEGAAAAEQLPTGANNENARVFACYTCGKTYRSVQALGGHQNAHRTERFAMKRRQIEMKRHVSRQPTLLPRSSWPDILPAGQPPAVHDPVMMAGPSNVGPAIDLGGEDVDEDLDLTLKL